MSHHPLIEKLGVYQGLPIVHYIDAIEAQANAKGYSVNVIDPRFNPGSIDTNAMRLNVRTDVEGNIISFSIG